MVDSPLTVALIQISSSLLKKIFAPLANNINNDQIFSAEERQKGNFGAITIAFFDAIIRNYLDICEVKKEICYGNFET